MTMPIVVHIIGAPVACAEGMKDTWREVAAWAAGQLAARLSASRAHVGLSFGKLPEQRLGLRVGFQKITGLMVEHKWLGLAEVDGQRFRCGQQLRGKSNVVGVHSALSAAA